MKLVTTDDDDTPADPDPTDPDAPDRSLDAETDALRLVLSAVCHGHHTQAVLAAMTLVLQTILAEVVTDATGLDEFVRLFHTRLREKWLDAQPIDKVD